MCFLLEIIQKKYIFHLLHGKNEQKRKTNYLVKNMHGRMRSIDWKCEWSIGVEFGFGAMAREEEHEDAYNRAEKEDEIEK